MAIRRACFLCLLSVPLAASSVETTETLTRSVTTQHAQAQPSDPFSSQNRFSREEWRLSETEWRRYETLMRGIRGSVSPGTLPPIEVLGIHARDEAERREYARRWAQMMKEDAERILAFQRAYDEAWVQLNPAATVIDTSKVDALKTIRHESHLQTGDRLLFFTRLDDCTACRSALEAVKQAAAKAEIQLDIYFVDTPNDTAIRDWIGRQGFDAARIRKGCITFNRHRGELIRVAGVTATAPKIVRLRGQSLVSLEPYQLL